MNSIFNSFLQNKNDFYKNHLVIQEKNEIISQSSKVMLTKEELLTIKLFIEQQKRKTEELTNLFIQTEYNKFQIETLENKLNSLKNVTDVLRNKVTSKQADINETQRVYNKYIDEMNLKYSLPNTWDLETDTGEVIFIDNVNEMKKVE